MNIEKNMDRFASHNSRDVENQSNDDRDQDNQDQLVSQHTAWTSKQGHILTGGGKAEEFYNAQRGFPFQQSELPHHWLIQAQTHQVFQNWRSSAMPCSLIAGVWNRPLFVGGWLHSTDCDEFVYNIQSHNLFVDLRIPKSRAKVLQGEFSSLTDLSPSQLQLYARQHIFAGFSLFEEENNRPLCTRHHCIDWNFVGTPRPRPNKWWIERNTDGNSWKEHSYATDIYGQHYYSERWQRIGDSTLPRLAIRKSSTESRDGILVAIGDHFNYVLARNLEGTENQYPEKKSLVDLVDAAVAIDDLNTARAYLSIEGGHGRVSSGWTLDCAIPPWNEGKVIWTRDQIEVEGDSISSCYVIWKGEKWDLFDCSFENVQGLKHFLRGLQSLERSIPST